jgi:hypothetical protein
MVDALIKQAPARWSRAVSGPRAGPAALVRTAMSTTAGDVVATRRITNTLRIRRVLL